MTYFNTRLRMRMASMTTIAALMAGCATAGNVLPDVSTLNGKDTAILASAGPTDYALEKSTEGKGLATADSLGALSELSISMPQVEARLQTLMAPVYAAWPHPVPNPPRIKLALGNQYHAVTYPDGTILLHVGALDDLTGTVEADERDQAPYVQSDQELMYLLSHEYSHYALGHHNKTDFFGRFQDMAKSGISAYRTYSTLTRVKYQSDASGQSLGTVNVQDQAGLSRDIDKAIGLYEEVDALKKGGLAPAWNRSQEDDADALAYDLMTTAGVQGDFYADVFSKLKEQESLSEQLMGSLNKEMQTTTSQLMSSDTLTAALDGRGAQAGQGMFNDLGRRLTDTGMSMGMSYFGSTHRRPSVRSAAMSEYEMKVYPDADPFAMTERSTEIINQIRALPEFNDAKIATVSYYEAVGFHANGEIAQAKASIDKAIRTRFGGEPSILLRGALIEKSIGNRSTAKAYLKTASQRESANPRVYSELAILLVDEGNYAGADSALATGQSRGIEAERFLPIRIYSAAAANNPEKVIELTRACRATKRDDLIADCEIRRAGLDPETLTAEQKAELNIEVMKKDDGLLNGLNLFGSSK